jgi:hypothetical protein
MGVFTKSDPALRTQRDAEAKLARATASRDGMAERLRTAEATATEHRELARTLATEGADDVALAKAENAMRVQQDRAVTLRAAIGDIDSTIAGHKREIAEIIDQRMRAETSAAVAEMANALENAAEDFEGVASALEAATREASPIILDGHAISAFVMSARQQLPPAIEVLVDGLRNHAKAVLAGTARASLPVAAAPEPVLKVVESPPLKEIVALRNVKYANAQGVVVVVGQLQRASMPAALADQGMRAGAVALVTDPRVKDQIGLHGMMLPSEDRCQWVGPALPDMPAPTTYRPAIPHSTLGDFQVVDRGPPLTGRMPARLTEPASASRSQAPDDGEA